MTLNELFAEGPAVNQIGKKIGTKVGQAAMGVGAVAGAASGLGGRFMAGYKAGKTGKDSDEVVGKEDTTIDLITKVVDKRDLKTILDYMIASKPLDGYQTRMATKALSVIKDQNYRIIFDAVLKGRQLSQTQINSLQTMRDGL